MLFTALFFTAIHLFLRLKLLFIFDSDIGGIEIYPVSIIQQLMSGIPLYNDPEIVPFRVVQLMPLYYKTLAFIGNLLQLDPNEPYQIYVLSRSFSMLCNIFSLFIFYKIMEKYFSIDRVLAAAISIFFFLFYRELYYSRSDSLYLLFHILTLHYFFYFLKNEQKKHLILASIFGMFALFSKQTGAMVFAYMATVFFIEKKWKNLFFLCLSFAFLFPIYFQIFIGFENIYFWYKNNILGLRTGFDPSFYILMIKYRGSFYLFGWLILSFFMFKKYFFTTKIFEKSLIIGLCVAFIFTIVTGAKGGASFNHWTELWIFTLLLLAIYFSQNSLLQKSKIAVLIIYSLFLFSEITTTYALYSSIFTARKWRTDEPARYESQRKVANFIKNELKIKENEYVYTTFRDFLDLFLLKNTCAIHKDMVDYLYTPKTFLYPDLFPKLQAKAAKYVITSKQIPSEFEMDTTIIDTLNYKKIITIDDDYTIFEVLKPKE